MSSLLVLQSSRSSVVIARPHPSVCKSTPNCSRHTVPIGNDGNWWHRVYMVKQHRTPNRTPIAAACGLLVFTKSTCISHQAARACNIRAQQSCSRFCCCKTRALLPVLPRGPSATACGGQGPSNPLPQLTATWTGAARHAGSGAEDAADGVYIASTNAGRVREEHRPLEAGQAGRAWVVQQLSRRQVSQHDRKHVRFVRPRWSLFQQRRQQCNQQHRQQRRQQCRQQLSSLPPPMAPPAPLMWPPPAPRCGGGMSGAGAATGGSGPEGRGGGGAGCCCVGWLRRGLLLFRGRGDAGRRMSMLLMLPPPLSSRLHGGARLPGCLCLRRCDCRKNYDGAAQACCC